ncbi:hypothetical protein [Paenibacillus phytorum]|uniref:hypothetical protein n=1 Tax=Paenibacillus phytorum TaxID=2654977 RepID=UPI001FE72EFE|nr:hypothetical protein [Paenibacillus phytorum]
MGHSTNGQCSGLAQGLAYDNAASVKNMDATHFVLGQDSNHRFTRSHPLGDTGKIDVALLAVNLDSWLAPTVTEGSPISDQTKDHVLVDQKLSNSGVKIGSIIVDQASGTKWTVSGHVKELNQQQTVKFTMQSSLTPRKKKLRSFSPRCPIRK